MPASAAVGTINITPNTGPVETEVSISGSDFTPGKNYTIEFSTAIVKTGIIDSSGSFATTFAVPTYPRGQYPITVTTNAPDTSNTQYLTITPQIELSDSSGYVGDQFTVSGTGFHANSSVSIYFDDIKVGVVTTNASGVFSNATVTVPPSCKGSHTVIGKDTGGDSPGLPLGPYKK